MSADGTAPKPGQAQPAKDAVPVSQTLYINNLNDKIPKHDLRRALYTLFSTYGPVLDVVALKTRKMRGQAHIVFRDKDSSSRAMQALQGFEFLEKTLNISYGKGKSDIISRLDGSTTSRLQNAAANAPRKPATAGKTVEKAPPTSLTTPNNAVNDGSKSPQGIKRSRNDESEAESEPNQDDEDDEGSAMEVSDDED